MRGGREAKENDMKIETKRCIEMTEDFATIVRKSDTKHIVEYLLTISAFLGRSIALTSVGNAETIKGSIAFVNESIELSAREFADLISEGKTDE